MRLIVVVCLLFMASLAIAQQNDKVVNEVWEHLLSNRREEARKLFDDKLRRIKDDDMDLLVLDAFIDQDRGRLLFDNSFVQQISKFSESINYLYPLWNKPFMIGNVKSEGYNDLTYQRIDIIAGMPHYASDPFVMYYKAILDRRRYNYDSYNKQISGLNAIDTWQFCGVFENMNGSGINIEYEPEFYAKNDKSFNANSNGIVNWYVPAIIQNEGYHFYLNEAEYGNGIIYAQTFINSDADKRVILDFTASGPLKIFLNDTEIYFNDKLKLADLNAHHLQFNLKRGTNRLVLKSATTGSADYIYAALKNPDKTPVSGVTYHADYRSYIKSSLQEIAPLEIAPYYEVYFQQKLKEEPDNILYKLLLFEAYIANHKDIQALDVIDDLYAKYPNSSLLSTYMIKYFNTIGEVEKVAEIEKNMLHNDEDYYYSIVMKLNDGNWLQSATIAELEKNKSKAEKLPETMYGTFYEYMINLRNTDIDKSIQTMEKLIESSYNNEFFITLFAPMYATLKNDKEKSVKKLEQLLEIRDDNSGRDMLINYYSSLGRKEDAKKMINNRISRYPYFNYVYDAAINFENNSSNYAETVKLADKGLNNFPFSFTLMEKKGHSYLWNKRYAEAENMFRQSLAHHSGNNALRKTLYDILKLPDEADHAATKNIYELIKNRRDLVMKCDYGVNVLLDEYIINVFPEGGRKNRVVYIYKIINESGIEELKEYSLSESNFNIIKAEIVKPDGSIVPAEKNYNQLVFTNLKVNDVVYIMYESFNNGQGRFYKDFNALYYLNGMYPSQHSIFGIIYPQGVTFNHDVMNGDSKAKTTKIKDKTFMSWEKFDIPALPLFEKFTPNYADVVHQISLSSIKTWADISNWYADLVDKNMQLDNTSVKVFNELFPNGTTNISQEVIAYKIYEYIGTNITYSSLDFRQSGYVPQKPSKTINTKLGDCKDLSVLFVALAKKAGLRANLVLVQTNDNGIYSPKLPSLSFNHCIVKVTIDDKDYFLEMTNKYLPFKALPLNLYKAKALVISLNKLENEKSGIINLPFDTALKNRQLSSTTIDVEDNIKRYTSTHTVTGSLKSYYNELFSDAVTEDYKNKQLEENINSALNKVITLESAKLIANERFHKGITYETKFSVVEKLQSVGSLKILEVPYQEKVYTRDIISTENRKYDIEYFNYENSNDYESEIIINIPQNKEFTEVPDSRTLNYKNHSYSIDYILLNPSSLKVVRKVNVPWDNIKREDYSEYKKFVEEVIAVEEQIVGFK